MNAMNALETLQKLAELRFYTYNTVNRNDKWRYLVCDSDKERGEIAIGKFKCPEDADVFCVTVRMRFVKEQSEQ